MMSFVGVDRALDGRHLDRLELGRPRYDFGACSFLLTCAVCGISREHDRFGRLSRARHRREHARALRCSSGICLKTAGRFGVTNVQGRAEIA
jgi:hypothetical protein